jgi:hypothetical protein
MGEWLGVPFRNASTAEQYLADGREMRFVPAHHQALPRITHHGKIPASRQGWTDNYLCRPKKDKTAPGVFTFMGLSQRGNAVTCSSPIGDGLTCYFWYEVKVIPEGVSYDGFLNSFGGVFYQEAVELAALMIRAEPMARMTSGRDQVSKGLDVAIFPPELWKKCYELNDEQLAQRIECPVNLGRKKTGEDRGAYLWGQDLFDVLGFRDVSRVVIAGEGMVTGVQDLQTNITPLTSGVVVEAPQQGIAAMSDVATNGPTHAPAKAKGPPPPAAPKTPQPRVQITHESLQ